MHKSPFSSIATLFHLSERARTECTTSRMETPAADQVEFLSDYLSSLHFASRPSKVLPAVPAIERARNSLVSQLPTHGKGYGETIKHLRDDIVPGLNASSRSPHYYGFVTGGITSVAHVADNIVTAYDQNVQVHLPNETIATDVEDRALALLCELLDLDVSVWTHRTFTTGATASNVLGLACGREFIIAEASAHKTDVEISVGELGIVEAMRLARIDKIQILTTAPHSSLFKAASILGLGRASVVNVGRIDTPHRFDMARLKSLLENSTAASIVAVSASEVNSGLFATAGLKEMQEIRKMCDMHGAWIHVDGAFGVVGRVLNETRYSNIVNACSGLELADSITGDGHKLLNVPYDCGIYLSKYRQIGEHVFQNPNAAYLATSNRPGSIASPLNIGLENSRRFRALPVYANLVAYGKSGYQDMLGRQIDLSRGIARYIMESEHYELLPPSSGSLDERLEDIFVIVLFRAKDDQLNEALVSKIKETKDIYVSGTSWEGKPACRFAVSNWQASLDKDLPLIIKVLRGVLKNS